MLTITGLSGPQIPLRKTQEEQVRIRILSEYSIEAIVAQLVSIKGSVDLYCWYEGPRGLLKTCIDCMNKPFFDPIFAAKKDVNLFLYSLRGWNFKEWKVSNMPDSTPIGECIDRIARTASRCIYSFSFFRYCVQAANDEGLYVYVTEELPKKEWLKHLSANREDSGKSVSEFFDNQPSLFNCIKDWEIKKGYALMQYMEGYYLIQESVKNALSKGDKQVQVAFLLPRGEEMYYTSEGNSLSEFRNDVEKLLRLQFKEALNGIEVNVTFLMFQYKEGTKYRPYQNNYSPVIKEKELRSYF